MLEVSHLTKIYKTKGGVITKALDDVSLKFPETGMVFLLGKSGSGKSTLLNVCGGLDSPTSGEVIVKGRSSKNFKQSDFDSYRNTFVGFIFQEYNILNEFTVEENIALALELQNKPKDKEAINSLLEKVDLSGFNKRKPNTLSGGQKQRIAIARALIKNPEIIMADEPTGALDSVTGKQVLETLKKLSKDTLVIIVSHDHEFAENYGDRIIELKDGKVIKDITKTQEEQTQISKNVSVIGNSLCIKKGSELDLHDFNSIKEFLNTEDSIILTKGDEVESIKKASKINENGKKEVFKETDENKLDIKTYQKKDSKFISSKLPIKHAFKIGVSSLKSKPIRLFFTIILCTISFIMFDLLSTMTFYDSESTFKQTLKDSTYSFIKLNKEYKVHETMYYNGEKDYEYDNINETRFFKDEFDSYVTKFGSNTFTGITVNQSFNIQKSSPYWINEITSLAYMNYTNPLNSKINGSYPKNDNEILISSYTAEVIYNNKIFDDKTSSIIELSKKEDIIGKNLTLGGYTYKVVGIIDSGLIDPKYDEILSDSTNMRLQYEFRSYLNDELHLMAFVTEDRLKEISNEFRLYEMNDPFAYKRLTFALKNNGKYNLPEWGNGSYIGISSKKASDEIIYFNNNGINDNEVVVSRDMFYQLLSEYYSNLNTPNAWQNHEIVSQLLNKGIYEDGKFVKFTEKDMEEKFNALITKFKKDNITLKIGVKLFNEYTSTTLGELQEFKVVGVYLDNSSNYESKMLFSDAKALELWSLQKNNLEYYSEYETKYESQNTIYDTIYLPFSNNEEVVNMFWDIYKDNEYKADDSKTRLTSYMIESLEMIDGTIKEFSKVFLYVGIVLAVFSILLFSNFISVSISNKKKEIGILRAVGARSIDVFKIFFSESFVITLICVILSIISCSIISNLLNQEFSQVIGVSIFVFGILSFVVLIGIALLTAILATLLPVYNAAKKKPVESIRAI